MSLQHTTFKLIQRRIASGIVKLYNAHCLGSIDFRSQLPQVTKIISSGVPVCSCISSHLVNCSNTSGNSDSFSTVPYKQTKLRIRE